MESSHKHLLQVYLQQRWCVSNSDLSTGRFECFSHFKQLLAQRILGGYSDTNALFLTLVGNAVFLTKRYLVLAVLPRYPYEY